MKKTFFIVTAIVLINSVAFTQVRTISGIIIKADDSTAIPGVAVTSKLNPDIGTITDRNGFYKLQIISNNDVLIYSSMGMETVEIKVGNQSAINLAMQSELIEVKEILVVGYGSQNKKLLTGSVSSIGSKNIEDQTVPDVDNLLQGKLSGVYVTSNSGTPGTGLTVKIRGATSIQASSIPLYIVDGNPVNLGEYSQSEGHYQSLNAISSINPHDIESVQVLKDASYASIYGARAANGVILITTKRGSAYKNKVDFSFSTGTQEFVKKWDLLNADQYIEAMNEAWFNTYGEENHFGLPGDSDIDTDWQDEITRKAPISEYQLSASGGNKNVRYYFSGGYLNQIGTIVGYDYERFTGRVNLDVYNSDKFKISSSTQISKENNNRIFGDINSYGPLFTALSVEPTEPVYNEEGSYNTNLRYSNPVAMAREQKDFTQTFRTISSFFVEYEIFKDIVIKSGVNADFLNLRDDIFYPIDIGYAAGSKGTGISANSDIQKLGLEETVTYRINSNLHSAKILGGFSYENKKEFRTKVKANQFPTNDLQWITSAAEIVDGDANTTSYKLASYFGRLKYDFDNKYLLQFVFRADGSSKFGNNNKYGYFPSASIAYRISEENFMKGISSVSNLKIRGGYGITGNHNISNFESYTLWEAGRNYQGKPGIRPSQLGNPDLKWEKSITWEVGGNLGLFKDRIELDISTYKKTINDLLMLIPLSKVSGYLFLTENAGKIESRGVDIEINSVNMKLANGFNWSTSFNVSFIRTKILRLANDEPLNYGIASRWEVDHAPAEFYGYKFLRVDPATGDMVFEDINGDSAITSDDRTFIGNPNPDFFGGFTNTFSFKGLELSIVFNFVQGNDIYNHMRTNSEAYFYNNLDSRVLDRWKKPGDNTGLPRAEFANSDVQRVSSYVVEDGSYLRLKLIKLGYNIPAKALSRIKIKRLYIYASGQNLLTLTKYSGVDPDVNYHGTTTRILGTDAYTYPASKAYTFGFKIGL